ncbi:glyoxalase-like domain-containing protein [Advenella mimigardefordensis DPN7]|uniref:Glyoxalase-like domain-containing protein n=2 Tax=Advenella mimigardefordensis TaxID=302406 RepID=W0PJR7_ADVMD|nr:glyoxalase-like domain-containing protein [Advenella mimigardefordensis DPN7]
MMKKVYSIVITDKLQACADFYTRLFAFSLVFQEDWYIHLVHEQSGAELAFMAPNSANQPPQLQAPYQGAGVVLSIEVDDAEQEYRRLTQGEACNIFLPLKDESWGQRHFMLTDPAGVCVDVVEQRAVSG